MNILKGSKVNPHRVQKTANRLVSMARKSINSESKKLEEESKKKDLEIKRLQESLNQYCNRSSEYVIDSDNTIKIGAVGDTHIGSLDSNLVALNDFYKYAAKEGVELIVHTGDVMDGYHMHPGMEFEQNALGFAAQLELTVKNYPRVKGIKTYFITGNHDASFKKGAGVECGAMLAEARDDMIFLGSDTAYLTFETRKEDRKYHLLHPDGGTAYAISYKPQKVVDSYPGGNKPDVLLMGHYHKAEYLPNYRNVQVVQTGTFQYQTPYMARKATPAHLGGWILDDTFGSYKNIFKTTFIPYYEEGRRNEKKIQSRTVRNRRN